MPELGSLASDVKQATGATNETLLLNCPKCVEDYAKMNAVHFGGNAPAPYWLQCAKPVEGFADLKDKRIRVAAANSQAGETIKFRSTHINVGTSFESAEVGDEPGHIIGFFSAKGVGVRYEGPAEEPYKIDIWGSGTTKPTGPARTRATGSSPSMTALSTTSDGVERSQTAGTSGRRNTTAARAGLQA